MCFGSKDNTADEAPRPVAVSSAAPANPRSSYSKPVPVSQPAYASPSGPPPSAAHRSNEDYAPPPGPPPSAAHASAGDYAPPPGPPPSASPGNTDDFAPPPGPPPSAAARTTTETAEDYAPPPGPPPASSSAAAAATPSMDGYAPPAGPPPGYAGPGSSRAGAGAGAGADSASHDWRSAVPDTSLFPPPPAIFDSWERSPANNATEAEAEAGTAWCRQHPLNDHPLALSPAADPAACEAIAAHNVGLLQPAGYQGQLQWVRPGLWTGHSRPGARDSCLLGYPPLYAPSLHSPRVTGQPFTAYYEVRILDEPGRRAATADEVGLAIGLAALPYPNFRLPGWHRGSLAVHGDDGHRYVNDIWGGKTFTDPFRRGDTYGLGMRFAPGRASAGDIDVEVFFTRNGVEVGRWNLHEETDAVDEGGIAGLSGFHDLSVAVGTFDAVSFEVLFEPSLWKYKGVYN